jgi:hypothetical protein
MKDGKHLLTAAGQAPEIIKRQPNGAPREGGMELERRQKTESSWVGQAKTVLGARLKVFSEALW